MTALVWLRDDLRLQDHPALQQALSDHGRVEALYVFSQQQYADNPFKFKHRIARLKALCKELGELGVALFIETAEHYDQQVDIVLSYAKRLNAHIYLSFQPGYYECERDQRLKNTWTNTTVHQSDTIAPLGSVVKDDGEMYKVFTPFKKRWLQQFPTGLITSQDVTSTLAPLKNDRALKKLDELSREEPVYQRQIETLLMSFCNLKLNLYARDRDYPYLSGGSGLSPYLAIGAISAQRVLHLSQAQPFTHHNDLQSREVFTSEIIWREFYRHLLNAYPHLAKGLNFQRSTQPIRWQNNDDLFQRWCQGQTGYPLVDAAMRCLNSTGKMHNRLRMVVASFLCKDLLIDWRWGEEYFMNRLEDADFASNNGGWQWAASTGADAAPYFRIFSPCRQSERFDKEGLFIRTWVKELVDCSSKQLHNPTMIDHVATGYPSPCVDHATQTRIAIEAFKSLKNA